MYIHTLSLSFSPTQVSKRFETKLALVLHFYHPYGYTLHALRLADTRQGETGVKSACYRQAYSDRAEGKGGRRATDRSIVDLTPQQQSGK